MLSIMQRQLNLRVYYYFYTDNIDGIEGTNTKTAYKKFQSFTGLTADGIYGTNTNNKLIEVIKDIQNKLNSKGYSLEVDGMVGDATTNAIKDFQSKNGLTVDGIVGEKTYVKLNNSSSDWSTIKYFKKSEFTCKCGCGLNNIDINLVKILDGIREHYNKPIIINSGSRCEKHNREVGGVADSKHLYGKAADFVVSGVPVADVLNYTHSLVKSGVLRYTYGQTLNMQNTTHIDIN